MGTPAVCKVPEAVMTKFKAFRKSNAKADAIVFTCNKDSLEVEIDEEFSNTTMEDLATEMPTSVPRFIIFSYEWKREDNRVQYPLVFISYSPPCNPLYKMLYTATAPEMQKRMGLSRMYEIKDPEDMTTDWLEEKLRTTRA